MRIIDKTPFQNDKGAVDFLGRIQGTLKYGPSWYPELEAQKIVIAQLDRLLEKGYVLIRNFVLPGSEVIIPMILLGPSAVYVIYVTHLKGFYEAKGDQWNKVDQGRSTPAPRNLISITDRLTRAAQKYFELQKIKLPAKAEAVLMAADPGLNIDSLRTVIRVVKSDAITQFAAAVLQNRSVLRNEQVYELAERIVDPQQPPMSEPMPAAESQQSTSRAKAIFDAGKPASAPDGDLSFAFDEQTSDSLPPGQDASIPSRAPIPAAAGRKLILGLAPWQVAVLAGLLILWLCSMMAFGAYIVYYQNTYL